MGRYIEDNTLRWTRSKVMNERARNALTRLSMCAKEECEMCKHRYDCNYDKQVERAIENTSIILKELERTADAEPIRHGKWIENDTVTYRLYELNNGERYCQEIIYPFVCSECRGGSEYKSRYCMDCGAVMDKEDNDGKIH